MTTMDEKCCATCRHWRRCERRPSEPTSFDTWARSAYATHGTCDGIPAMSAWWDAAQAERAILDDADGGVSLLTRADFACAAWAKAD